MADAITGTTPAATAATKAASTSASDTSALGRARLAENFDTFLSLLTAQLKNQDPLSPLDSNQFTSQLTQMTGVEQQLLTNDLLKKLVSNTGSGVATAVSLIGKEVRAASAEGALKDGKAEWTYKLDRAAADVKLDVLDSKGRVVKSFAPSDNKAGEHKLSWDGKSAAGSTVPDGAYSLRVTAKDSGGTAVNSTTYITGLVTGVEQADGQTLVTIKGTKVPWEQITQINQPAPETADGVTDNPDGKTPSPAAA